MTKWMLVEDEPDIYDLLDHLYSVLGVRSMIFTTGEDAQVWLNAVDSDEITDDLPVFALIDLRLPGDIDGIQVGERLRRSARLKNIPVVLMTAYKLSPAQEVEAVKRTRANLLLYKPLPRIAELHKMFTDLVN
jgi:CheY-like chemotaxis protein